MIAVEWSDWDAPREPKTNKSPSRTGILLSISPTTRDQVNIAYVITEVMPWDEGAHYPRKNRKIILPVQLSLLTVKGVHIPFEPHGAEK